MIMLPDTHLTQSSDSFPVIFSLCILKFTGVSHAFLKKEGTSLPPKSDGIWLEFSDYFRGLILYFICRYINIYLSI